MFSSTDYAAGQDHFTFVSMCPVSALRVGKQQSSSKVLTSQFRPADVKEDSAPGPLLALNVTQVTNNTLRPTTPKLSKHQTMTMTSVSRSTGRSDKAKRAQGNGLVGKGSCLLCGCPYYCCAVHVAKQYYGGVQRVAFDIAEQQHCCGVHAYCIGCCYTAALLWCTAVLHLVLLQSSMSKTCWRSWTACMKSVLHSRMMHK